MTAQEIVARIRQRLADQGISWRTETVDTFKAGNPDAQVTGIATTGMATYSVLKRAAKAGRNGEHGHIDEVRVTRVDAKAVVDGARVGEVREMAIEMGAGGACGADASACCDSSATSASRENVTSDCTRTAADEIA